MAEPPPPEPSPDNELEKFKKLIKAKEKVEKIHFFVEINQTGPNQNSFEVARATITPTSPTSFGLVRVVDEPMKVAPNPNSMELGRDQGLVVYSGLTEAALTLVLNFYFTAGKYKGSTLSLLGRDAITMPNRELPIVGGTADLRLARGYAIVNQYSGDTATGNSILEYKMYVAHPEGN